VVVLLKHGSAVTSADATLLGVSDTLALVPLPPDAPPEAPPPRLLKGSVLLASSQSALMTQPWQPLTWSLSQTSLTLNDVEDVLLVVNYSVTTAP
jgi:hypothetical protein